MLRAARYPLGRGAAGLGVLVAVLALATGPADARRKRVAYDPPYAAMVVDANSGRVLHASNADARRYPASLTKIMTLYLLFEQIEAGKLKLSSELKVSEHAAAQPPSKLGLEPGETISVANAIRALVTKSANDVAVIVAEAVGGDEVGFARMMTRKALALGMTHTQYRNASGLPDDDQVTTARDQVLLGRAIRDRFPKYYGYFATRSFAFRGRSMRNHNRLLGAVEGVDGIKTGYIRASGFNLVSSVQRGPRHIVGVVLGGRTASWRDARMRQLIAANIGKAATGRTAAPVGERPEQETPPKRPEALMANAAAARAPETVTQNDPRIGSTAPIKAIAVKTYIVRPAGGAGPMAASTLTPPAKSPKVTTVATVKTEPPLDAAASPQAAAQEKVAIPAVPRTTPDKSRGSWIIQVGAFDAESDAKQRLTLARNKAGAALKNADPFTETVEKGSKTFYRARFAGFAEKEQAEDACKHLRRGEIPCMLLKN